MINYEDMSDFKAIADECRALAKEIHPKATCDFSVSHDHELSGAGFCRLYLRPRGYAGNDYIFKYGNTFAGVLAATRAEWAERSANFQEQLVKDMALAIIRLTSDNGECTTAALRAEFDSGDVEMFSAKALERANEMAANGPFEIVETAGENGG